MYRQHLSTININMLIILAVYVGTDSDSPDKTPYISCLPKKGMLKMYHLEERRSGRLFPILDNLYTVLNVQCHYLVNVYSLSPEWRFMAEKVPMQPRSRLSRPVFHVTKRGLKKGKHKTFSSPKLIMDNVYFCYCPKESSELPVTWRTLAFCKLLSSG